MVAGIPFFSVLLKIEVLYNSSQQEKKARSIVAVLTDEIRKLRCSNCQRCRAYNTGDQKGEGVLVRSMMKVVASRTSS